MKIGQYIQPLVAYYLINLLGCTNKIGLTFLQLIFLCCNCETVKQAGHIAQYTVKKLLIKTQINISFLRDFI